MRFNDANMWRLLELVNKESLLNDAELAELSMLYSAAIAADLGDDKASMMAKLGEAIDVADTSQLLLSRVPSSGGGLVMQINGEHVSLEGVIVYGCVAYETTALTVNVVAHRKVLPPITDVLGPLTQHRYGWIIPGFLIAWGFHHFYKNGQGYAEGRRAAIHEMQAFEAAQPQRRASRRKATVVS